MKISEEKKMFAREVAVVERLVYDEICDEVHEIGKDQYWGNVANIDEIIENTRNAMCDKFLTDHPEYSGGAFHKVWNFILAEGRDMAAEMNGVF